MFHSVNWHVFCKLQNCYLVDFHWVFTPFLTFLSSFYSSHGHQGFIGEWIVLAIIALKDLKFYSSCAFCNVGTRFIIYKSHFFSLAFTFIKLLTISRFQFTTGFALAMEPGRSRCEYMYTAINSLLPIAIVSVYIDCRPARACHSDSIRLSAMELRIWFIEKMCDILKCLFYSVDQSEVTLNLNPLTGPWRERRKHPFCVSHSCWIR